ncbi:acyltransferase family protein [Paraburkholderia sp. BR10954]|uniref:acyltransferase family protein n=1 Tax=Paraburkholderia sp. BR10954 TaxID=3236995 RepID=UPI0034D3089A
MGTLRYLLASLVLLSHLGYSVAGLNPGVVAVVIFYLLAGHVVAGLWQKWQSHPAAAGRFYADRLWRILPQYFCALLAATVLWRAGAQSPFLLRSPGLFEWLANLLVIPLGYFMYTGFDSFVLVPPAWSLAVELQFYLLAPWLLRLSPRRWGLTMLASLTVFAAAQLQWLDTDHFGYRLLPGVLFIFLAGGAIRQTRLQSILLALWLLMAAYLLVLLLHGPAVPYNREVALGLVLGLPLLKILRGVRPTGVCESVDRLLANLSYGVFVWHFPVLWSLHVQPGAVRPVQAAAVLALSSLLALVTHYGLERAVWTKVRRFERLSA